MKYYLITCPNPLPRECGISKLLLDENMNEISYNNITCFYEQRLNSEDLIFDYINNHITETRYDYEDYHTGETSEGIVTVEEITEDELEETISYVERGW